MAEIIRVVLLNLEITNGAAGLSGIPRFLDWTWLFVLTVGSVWLIGNFLHSRHGRDCIAVREDEIAAESGGGQLHAPRRWPSRSVPSSAGWPAPCTRPTSTS